MEWHTTQGDKVDVIKANPRRLITRERDGVNAYIRDGGDDKNPQYKHMLRVIKKLLTA